MHIISLLIMSWASLLRWVALGLFHNPLLAAVCEVSICIHTHREARCAFLKGLRAKYRTEPATLADKKNMSRLATGLEPAQTAKINIRNYTYSMNMNMKHEYPTS